MAKNMKVPRRDGLAVAEMLSDVIIDQAHARVEVRHNRHVCRFELAAINQPGLCRGGTIWQP